jgi:hypothetical protein
MTQQTRKRPSSVAARAVQIAREQGGGALARAIARDLVRRVATSYPYYKIVKSRQTFTVDGRRYRYFYHPYNSTWKTERAVETPLAWEIVQQHAGRRILEVGNVLSHYFPVAHTIVDKYERAPGVINQDIVDFDAGQRYDLIISISTIEHVGWDEEPREPEKLLRAVAHLEELAAPGGLIVLTLPLAYNSYLDEVLRAGRLAFDRQICLRRISHDNRWAQVDWPGIRDAGFNTPFRGINGLLIGVKRKT